MTAIKDLTILRLALLLLGVLAIMCVGGIIWLSLATPARAIPDILVGTTTLIVGGILGILVPSKDVGA